MFCKQSKQQEKSKIVFQYLIENKIFQKKSEKGRMRSILHDIFYYRLREPLEMICGYYLNELSSRVESRSKRLMMKQTNPLSKLQSSLSESKGPNDSFFQSKSKEMIR